MYQVVDAAVVRAAALRLDSTPTVWPDLADTTSGGIAAWRRWLGQVWACEEFAAAVEVASPVLARRVRGICAGQPRTEREVRRAVLSIARYLLRARSRVTPFGLFAGVAPTGFGPVTAHVGDEHRVATRVDTTWMAKVVTRLEDDPNVRHRLPVVANNAAFVRDGKLVISYRQADDATDSTPTDVSIRHSDAVRTVINSTREPVVLGELAHSLATAFPLTAESVIHRVLADLVRHGFLRTNLRPPMTSTDPLAHVIETLTAVGADNIQLDTGHGLAELREIHSDLSKHDQANTADLDHELRAAASTKMTAITRSERPVAIDLRLDANVVLPEAVAREAEAAATALVRLTPEPFGAPNWQTYHGQFLERYGVGAAVPVTELVHGDTGLGFPVGYRDSRLPPPPDRGMSERDKALLTLVQHATMQRRDEIELDEDLIARLAVDDLASAAVQPHTQLRVRVHAPTLPALRRGEFELAVTGVSRAAGISAGRFLDTFDVEDRERIVRASRALPTIAEDAIPVQVSCPPLYPRAENVARTPAVLRHVLSLAEHPQQETGTQVVPLADLAVTADPRRLYLLSMSQRRPIEPVLLSAVEMVKHSDPLLRFLCEISTARAAQCTAFSWGAAGALPFLPRLRYRRTILSPARWTLSATDLPGPTASWRSWATGVTAWRDRNQVPGTIYLGESDRRLRLDLTEQAHLHLLRAELDRAGSVSLREAPGTDTFGWIDGRAHEIVIPLAATTRPIPRRTWPSHVTSRDLGHLPGTGGWLYVKLYGHPERQDTILTTHVPALLAALDPQPQWWFLRYHDPHPHLRLRIQLADHDFGQLAGHIGTWATGLRHANLVGQVQVDTYYPETGRFGHGAAMSAAETVFAADSAAAIAQLAAAAQRGGPHRHAIIAASMVDLAVGVTGGFAEGLRWLVDHVPRPSIPGPDRAVHDEAIRLTDPYDGNAVLRALPGGDSIAVQWTRRREALDAYRAALTAQGEITPASVLPDLLHLHHVRMAGVSPDLERACGHLARAAALSWTRRTGRPEPAS